MPFSDDQLERYSRQLILKEFDLKGMDHLRAAKIGIIGAGGLGCPAAQLLAGVGIGHLKIIDFDKVDLSNLPRQILHYTGDIGKYKVDSVQEKIHKMNPDVDVIAEKEKLTRENIDNVIQDCDYVLECSDSSVTKFLVNDYCVYKKIPFTIAGSVQFGAQILSVLPGETACYRCIFDEPVNNSTQTCSNLGVFSGAPMIAGELEATEAIKYLLKIPSRFTNKLLAFDLLVNAFNHVLVQKNSDCKACAKPEIAFWKTADYNPTDSCRSDLDRKSK